MTPTYQNRILRVPDHIHSNPAGDLSLDTLADVAAISCFHQHRVFHGKTGETLADAVRRIRLRKSACRLVQTVNLVTDVGSMAGFGITQRCVRAFRKAYSQSPVAFRKQGKITSPYHPKSKGNLPILPAETETTPDRRLLAVPHKGSYMEIAKAFEKLRVIVASRGLGPQIRGMIGAYYDDPSATKAADLHSRALLQRPFFRPARRLQSSLWQFVTQFWARGREFPRVKALPHFTDGYCARKLVD